MQGSRFDAFARWTAKRSTRRAAVTQLGTGVAAAFGLASLGARPVTAQVATPAPEASPAAAVPVSLLYVQYAGPTTLTPGTGDVHTLTMTEVRPQTIYFSDRPNRVAGAEPTASFVDGFALAFADSAPNASLIGHLESGDHQEEAVVLTLLSAAYDEAAATLTYEVTLLDGELITDEAFEREPLTTFDAPRGYAEASLFIDDVPVDSSLCIAEGESYGSSVLQPETWSDLPCCPGLVPDVHGSCVRYIFAGTCTTQEPAPCGVAAHCCDAFCADAMAWNSIPVSSAEATFTGCEFDSSTPSLYTSTWACKCYP